MLRSHVVYIILKRCRPRMNSQCKPSKIVLSIQSPDGRTLVREEIRVGDNAHLDDNISVVTILDAIGFGQYAELFEIKQVRERERAVLPSI